MELQAMAEILLYGALFLGMCMLLATRAPQPVEVEEEVEPERYQRNRGKRKVIRYYL